jgi:hypothetical protein
MLVMQHQLLAPQVPGQLALLLVAMSVLRVTSAHLWFNQQHSSVLLEHTTFCGTRSSARPVKQGTTVMENHEVPAQHTSTLTQVGVFASLRLKAIILRQVIKQRSTLVPQVHIQSLVAEIQPLTLQLAKLALLVIIALTLQSRHKLVSLERSKLQLVRLLALLALLQGLSHSSVNLNAIIPLLATYFKLRLMYPVCALPVHTVQLVIAHAVQPQHPTTLKLDPISYKPKANVPGDSTACMTALFNLNTLCRIKQMEWDPK